jgi:hypothetical protein
MVGSGDKYLALPELPLQYSALQSALDGLENENGYVSPETGAHRQPVQMVDLDGDGIQEVVVFGLTEGGLCQVYVLREYGGIYAVSYTIEGGSPYIFEVLYPTLMDGNKAIAIAWGRTGDLSRGVTVIAMENEHFIKVLSFSGQSYLFEDTDGDGADEIWYADRGGTAWIRSRLHRYEYREGDGFYPTGRLNLAAEASNTISLQYGLCGPNTPAVFADSYTEDGKRMVTDLVVESESGLISMTQGLASSAENTLRRTYALCADINGDGILEIPVADRQFPVWLPLSGQFIEWCDFSWDDRQPRLVQQTFCISGQGLAMVLPDNWDSGVRVTYWSDDMGRPVYSFYDIRQILDEEEGSGTAELLMRLCIGEVVRLEEIPYDNICVLNEVAVGYYIEQNSNINMRPEKHEIETGLLQVQDRW